MKQFTYSILGDEDKLIFEKLYDANNRLIQSIDHSQLPREEVIYTFNEAGQLIRESILSEGRVFDEHQFDYNEKGEIEEQRHFINGDLYEKVVLETTDFGYQHRTIQENVEIERKEHEGDKQRFTVRYFDYENLVETHVHAYDSDAKTMTTLITYPDSTEEMKRVEQFNEKDELMGEILYLANGEIHQDWKRTFNDNLVTKEYLVDHINPSNTFRMDVEHDANGNIISKEKRTESDKLIAFEKNNFDAENRLVETVKMNGQTKVHLRFEYHD